MPVEDSVVKSAHAIKIGRAQMKFRVLRSLAQRRRELESVSDEKDSSIRLDEVNFLIQLMRLIPFTNDDD